MFGFEKLEVWQKAIEYADCIYDITRVFPSDERFGLTSQMRRSAVSVSSNIAEGSGRGSNADFGRFVGIGYASLMETVSQTHIGQRQQFLDQRAFDDVYQRAEQLARMLSGLKSSLERR
ncbi:MAG: four helix bundle protein [Planctomycetota bacterium]